MTGQRSEEVTATHGGESAQPMCGGVECFHPDHLVKWNVEAFVTAVPPADCGTEATDG